MDNRKRIKEIVRDKYADLAKEEKKCCCSSNKQLNFTVFNESYENLPGYVKDADLNLGCGVPTEYVGLEEGQSVIDLGCGAGNDCFISRSIVGETGKVVGIDFTDEMIEKARKNAGTLGYKNVEFLKGDIENIPVDDGSFDVVISNCVLNLVPDKEKAFSEIHRILKKNGHFCVSDIVLKGSLPEKVRETAALYAGCVSGALQMDEYLAIIKKTEFTNIEVKKERQIHVPNSMFLEHISIDELEEFRSSGTGIYSITVVGSKE
jgi:SAM-dependent methyltransferase